MSWLFPLTKSASSSAAGSPGGLTSLQQQKQRLIESLRNSHSSIAEIQKDVEYRLPFTVNNLTININILLPPQFPQEKPVISVYPPIRHHLMDKQGVYVTSPLVNNFTMHSDLGKIIQSLLDEFWKNPPVLAPSSTAFPYLYSNPGGMPPYASQGFPFLPPYPPQEANRTITSLSVADTISSSTTSYTPAKPAAPSFGVLSNLPLPVPTTDTSAPISQDGFGYKMPDIPDTFPELSELSVSQLTDMNEQEEILLEQFLTLPQLKQIITDKDDLVKSIEELAKPSLEAKRQTVLDKYELLTQLKSTFEKKMQRQHELSESCSASALQARLKVAAHEAEEESDNIAEDFLEGKTEIDDFLSSFMEKRTICHCRRAKEEKLQQAIAMHSQFHAPL
ncbi:vacuolar protein sorting-associated protein 37A isoform X2 [Mirounga angustirostris]|uniref:Vacuolar protein sorting-associated protein 37A n=1 Tax=Leptonychotes weddellii TaxID=9713 RepID=A0A7F8RTS1_LEPWE|nr:vacuolar protein sorting-associated protein 37A isoform X2 [Leptonychotes weddellii]XP_032269415.1 vacuolar protein sorting-associated protein 37A isoform X2 [Phoca vitulina]XP_034860037.1 vacuolar protein sorting-associated protein 37A isoform X2 [Mirounga leonina]XP_035957720.1 vacuolar protein sorting-associated protein 37A isoform X2 [Halichoerus grypus]XP_045735687.1 vacuolar protein sorting-associated protein 37A isoform X2 [Mirounga angustirostris]